MSPNHRTSSKSTLTQETQHTRIKISSLPQGGRRNSNFFCFIFQLSPYRVALGSYGHDYHITNILTNSRYMHLGVNQAKMHLKVGPQVDKCVNKNWINTMHCPMEFSRMHPLTIFMFYHPCCITARGTVIFFGIYATYIGAYCSLRVNPKFTNI